VVLHLSACRHEIIIVDNLSRRKINLEPAADSPTPIPPSARLRAWEGGRRTVFRQNCR